MGVICAEEESSSRVRVLGLLRAEQRVELLALRCHAALLLLDLRGRRLAAQRPLGRRSLRLRQGTGAQRAAGDRAVTSRERSPSSAASRRCLTSRPARSAGAFRLPASGPGPPGQVLPSALEERRSVRLLCLEDEPAGSPAAARDWQRGAA